jgi:hypothetical protein
MQKDIQKSRPGNRVGEVHQFGLRFRNGSTVSVTVTIPADGQATNYLLRWTGTPGRGDRKAYAAWRASICETLSAITGRQFVLRDYSRQTEQAADA